MKVTVAPDSFKESLSAPGAAKAIRRGLRNVDQIVEIELVPVADGGEGTTTAMVAATKGSEHKVSVRDPLGRHVSAIWGLCGDGATSVIEMASASGLPLLTPEERNPMLTSTYGTGELMSSAFSAGAEKLIIGIGGSATVDGGTGMAQAIGIRFLDGDGNVIENCSGGRLVDIEDIDLSRRDPQVGDVEIIVACDVTNPLLGPDGAARIYGPQKGATPEQVEELEAGMAHLAEVIKRRLDLDVADQPGAGAAGGLGAGLMAFAGAHLQSGVDTVLSTVKLAERMAGSDLVITGEGRLDKQSAFGKAPAGVAALAAEQGIPCVVLAGSVGPGYEQVYEHGVCAVFSILDRPMELEEAMADAHELLTRAAESVLRLWKAASKPDLQ